MNRRLTNHIFETLASNPDISDGERASAAACLVRSKMLQRAKRTHRALLAGALLNAEDIHRLCRIGQWP